MRGRQRLGLLLLTTLAICHTRAVLADSDVQASIVNGFNAPKNRYTWVVSLRADDGQGDWHFCMGALIHESIVMTSASCVRDPETGKDLPKEYFYPLVRIGGYYRLSDRARGYQLRKVVQTVVNPGFVTGYVNDNSNNDIALLLLDKPSTKPPIGLPKYTAKPKMPLPAMSSLLAVGWGWTSPDIPSEAEMLQEIRMSLLPLRTCQRLWGRDRMTNKSSSPPIIYNILSNFFKNNMLCAADAETWPRPYGGACWGDGGAPYFRPGPKGQGFVQYAIDSYGPSRCGRGSYVVTDVAALRPWIDQTVQGLTSNEWKGRVWGDPNVLGFDGSRFQTTTPAGRQLVILNCTGPMSLVASLAKHPYLPNFTIMRHIRFKWGGEVVVGIWNHKTYVTVNGATLLPGQTVKILGGKVRYRERLARWSQSITIVQLSMSIRINRVWSKREKDFYHWFDIWVFLTSKPRWPLGGVLGDTFPEMSVAAAGSDDLVGGFVLPSEG